MKQPDTTIPSIIIDKNFFNSFLFLLWKRKILIFSILFLFAMASILFALSLPNKYQSQALLMQAHNEGTSLSQLSQYSSVASLAGISIPSSPADKTMEAIVRIESFEFFAKYFLPTILLQDLIASNEWQQGSNTVTYDDSLFNSEINQWVREVGLTTPIIPSEQEAYEYYKKIMSIKQDKKSGFVTVSIQHISPYMAQEWVQNIIIAINQSMRDEEKYKTMLAIDFLNNQALKVNYEDIKKSISNLLQDQMKSLMLIEANKDYVFKVLDSPIAPERKFHPNRAIIVIWSVLLGFILSLLIIFRLDYHKLKS